MLGYPTGLQLWDCSNLSSVAELLNLTGSQWGAVEFACILPDPPRTATDELRQKRPLVAFSYVSRSPPGAFRTHLLQISDCTWHGLSCIFTTLARSCQEITPNRFHVVCCIFAIYYSRKSSPPHPSVHDH